eukprot:TRINITY_DN81866_c0_g1_i1.p1 TRINITY_DN81866_c0_g1~~TRINITY_DN81866_c0_g1_i1.p1  ORF type:complete len:453 (-),score=85.01 TRINITY_DN81866_c0_g1_i1:68-1402(-)
MAGSAGNGRPLLQIAPMMEVTYRDFRYFMRLLTRRTQLWTEMVVDDTVLHNLEPERCDRFLGFHKVEHPIVCQLGGSDPSKLAETAKVVERYGYDEVNLNVGCPSCRVAQKGEFGCSLMKRKEVVRDCIHAMSRAVQIPVTVKCRLGVDDLDSPDFTREFVRTVAQGGCRHFVIHSRKAWLNGLSPAQNRSIPPLHYPRVLDLCREFPDLSFSVNGGVNDIGHARALLGYPGERLDGETEELMTSAWGWPGSDAKREGPLGLLPPNFQGVMIGRGAMNTPCMLWDVDHSIYGDAEPKAMTRRQLLEGYKAYLEEAHPDGSSVGAVHMAMKPTLGIFAGLRGNKAFRSTADSLMRVKETREQGPAHVLELAIQAVDDANPGILDEPLSRTTAYKPPKASSAPAADIQPRGRKRKIQGTGGAEADSPGDIGICAAPLQSEVATAVA